MFSSRKQRLAEAVVQATIQAKLISETLAEKISITLPEAVTIKPTPFPSFMTEIWTPDSGRVKVLPGETKKIYEFKIASTYFGVVRGLAWNYYAGDQLQLSIDDQPVYNQPIKWALGEYPNTTVIALKPFNRKVMMTATNKSTNDNHFYGMICKGPVVYQKDKALLLDLVAKGAV
jgi:hypothetical protein